MPLSESSIDWRWWHEPWWTGGPVDRWTGGPPANSTTTQHLHQPTPQRRLQYRSTGPPVHRSTRSVHLSTLLTALLTPLLEKNAIKTLSIDTPVVFSMSRLIVLSFAIAVMRQIWRAGIAGWPDATLAIAIVLALPMLGALERVRPTEVVELAKTLVSRFGVGAVRSMRSVYGAEREPSKFDDHSDDAGG